MVKKLGNNLIVLTITILINLVLFSMIPLLSQIKEERPSPDYIGDPVTVTYQEQKIEPSSKRKEIKDSSDFSEKKPEQRAPKDIDFLKQTTQSKKPQINMEMPEIHFEVSELDIGSVKIKAPKAPPQPVREASSVGKAKEKFDLQEVDRKPQVLSKVRPVYPYRARLKEISGKVVLKFIVNKNGSVTNVSVVNAEPKGVFEKRAIAAIKKWNFEPGYYQGKAVNTWVTLPIRFELAE